MRVFVYVNVLSVKRDLLQCQKRPTLLTLAVVLHDLQHARVCVCECLGCFCDTAHTSTSPHVRNVSA
jgi:hypothetical protein